MTRNNIFVSLSAKTIFSSFVALFVDYGTFHIFSNILEDVVTAYRVGLSLGASVQFLLLNEIYGDHNRFLKKSIFKRIFIYGFLFFLNLALGGSLMLIFNKYIENIFISKFFVILIFFCVNFLCYRFLIWRTYEEK